MKKLKLGKVQTRVMNVLWDKKRATALEITEEMNKTEPIKHSTVQTFLRTLVNKDIVKFDVENRTFVYYPTVNDEQIKKHAIEELIEQSFQGSANNLVSYIVKNEYIDLNEFEKIKEELKNKKK